MADIRAQNETTLASVKAIYDAADEANTLLDGMQTAATAAGTTLNGIYQVAKDAEQSAQDAQASADSASEYASRALGNLSTVQSVTETLAWITAHGTMTLTTDTALDPSHVYFVVDANGDYVVGGTHYSVVSEPSLDDISTYYELSIDESLNNYVATHLAVDSEGLWIIPDSGGNKVLIATGSGTTYTTSGTYIVGATGTLASFTATGATIGQNVSGQARSVLSADGMQVYRKVSGTDTQIVSLGYGLGRNESGQLSYAPYNTLGIRATNSTIGNYSTAEGKNNTASGYGSHAEGVFNVASGVASHAEGNMTNASANCSHAEGQQTTARGDMSHAEGEDSYAGGWASHAQNIGTNAHNRAQTALGEYNIIDTSGAEAIRGTYSVIIGNGTSDSARSNALTVDWSGNVVASGDITDGSGNVLSDKADTSSVPTMTSILNFFYPVGSYYETSDTSFDPNVTWGGTWSLETEGQVHVSSGTNYAVSGATTNISDGGASTVTLTANQLPKITGTITPLAWSSNNVKGVFSKGTSNFNLRSANTGTANALGTQYYDLSFGNNEAHNNMQPYIVVNRWHRTA